MKHALCILLLMLVSVGELSGQDVSFVPFEGLAGALQDSGFDPGETAAMLQEFTQEFALYALGRTVYASLVEEGRIDKQVGATGGSSGSTSLVSKGSVPALLGFAVEAGSLYQSISDSVVTFRLNPAGLARALAAGSYVLAGTPPDESALEQVFSRLSVSGSFDLQQGASPGVFTGERSQLREASARFNIINQRDPRHPSHAESVQELSGRTRELVATVQDLFNLLEDMPGYDDWRITSATMLADVDLANDAALMEALTEIGDDFSRRFGSEERFQQLASSMVETIDSYRTVRDSVFAGIANGSTFAFEYAFSRMPLPEEALSSFPVGATVPDLSTARLILSSPIGNVGEATVNGSITIFNSTLPQMQGSLRDVQVAVSVDLRLPEIQSVGRPVLTIAGLGAFLHQQPFGVNVTLQGVDTADGAIGVFQTKLTFPAGKSGVRIPLSITVANRSEFNTKSEVRGAIGLTFDMDKLFSRP